MAPTELPGYYYDEVKKKYFKIQENHLASPSLKYSRGALKKEAEFALVRKRKRDREQLEREQTIQQSKVLGHSLLGREIGCRENGTAVRWDVWAKGLVGREALRIETDDHHDISHFTFDEPTGSFIFAIGKRLITGVLVEDQDSGKGVYRMVLAACMDGLISSMALSPSRVLLTVVPSGPNGANIQIDRFVSPETLYPYTRRGPLPESSNTIPELLHNGSTQLQNWGFTTFWACSACPNATRSDFALGSSSGTILVTENQTGWVSGGHQGFENITNSDIGTDVLAVDWQSTNVVINGCRDKTVRLWDIRAGGIEGTSLRLRHPSTINHVRKLSDNSIIVAGMERQLCSYDLRFLPNIKATSHGMGASRPFTTFPEYQTRELQALNVGFDVYEDVVAAGVAEGSEHHGVQLFDAKSGRQMSAPVRNEDAGGAQPRCVRLVDGSHLWPAPSLMYSSWNGIHEWR